MHSDCHNDRSPYLDQGHRFEAGGFFSCGVIEARPSHHAIHNRTCIMAASSRECSEMKVVMQRAAHPGPPLRGRGRRCEGGGVRGSGLSEPRPLPVIDHFLRLG